MFRVSAPNLHFSGHDEWALNADKGSQRDAIAMLWMDCIDAYENTQHIYHRKHIYWNPFMIRILAMSSAITDAL
jgi:hypothetical protein